MTNTYKQPRENRSPKDRQLLTQIYRDLRAEALQIGITDKEYPRRYKPIGKGENIFSIDIKRLEGCIGEELDFLRIKRKDLAHQLESTQRELEKSRRNS